MRLIDADALKAFINERMEQGEPYYCERDLNGFDMICMLCDAQTVMEWHDAKRKRPEHSGEYLVWAPEYGGRRILSYDMDNRVVRTWYYYYGDEYVEVDKDDIIAWAELPEPPKEEA